MKASPVVYIAALLTDGSCGYFVLQEFHLGCWVIVEFCLHTTEHEWTERWSEIYMVVQKSKLPSFCRNFITIL